MKESGLEAKMAISRYFVRENENYVLNRLHCYEYEKIPGLIRG
jgi:hypothetical protein